MKIKSLVLHSALIIGICNYCVLPCRADLEKVPNGTSSDLPLSRTAAADLEADRKRILSIIADLKTEGLVDAECKDTSLFHYLKFAKEDIECALACLRTHLERRLRMLALPTCESAPPACISDLLGHLQLNKVLNSRQVNAIQKLTSILNDASHARWKWSPEIEEWLVKESPKLMATLERLAARAL
jgi:hypothetical protein